MSATRLVLMQPPDDHPKWQRFDAQVPGEDGENMHVELTPGVHDLPEAVAFELVEKHPQLFTIDMRKVQAFLDAEAEKGAQANPPTAPPTTPSDSE